MTANAAGVVGWTGTLYNNSNGNFLDTATYPTKAQAIAAVKALDPSEDSYGGRQALQETGPLSMDSATVTYNLSAPTVPPPTLSSTPYYLWYYVPDGTWEAMRWPDEASAAAVMTKGTCSGTDYHQYVLPNGEWSGSGPLTPPAIQTRQYQYWNEFAGSGCVPVGQGNANPIMGRGYSLICPSGYRVKQDFSTGAYSCVDDFSATVTGPLNECAMNGSPSTQVGDPCDVASGDFSQAETDYSAAGLKFERFYHSASLESSHNLGIGWTHNYSAHAVVDRGNVYGLVRPTGHQEALIFTGGGGNYYESLSGSGIHVEAVYTNNVPTYFAHLPDGGEEVYDQYGTLLQMLTPSGAITTLTYSAGLLTSVTGPFGQTLQFTYNANNQINRITDPNGQNILYGYDAHGNLSSVTHQDASVRAYLYEVSGFPNHLTGITDESGSRFLTVTYDSTTGVATSSQQAGGSQAVSMSYTSTTTSVTDSLGAISTYSFTSDPGYSPRVTSVSKGGLTQSFSVPSGATDSQRRVTQKTDAKGYVTTYAYNVDHLISKTEASGTGRARTTSYQYLNILTQLPTLVTEPLRKTAYSYYSGTSNVQTKTITDTATGSSRTWTYSYNSGGQLLSEDGPRTDVSDIVTYTYYAGSAQLGQLHTVTDAVGHVTTYNTYNSYGQPLTVTDANGVVTTLTYDNRQRLTSRNVGGENTSFNYWPTGLLKTVTLPDGATLSYIYDAAHRLKEIDDGLGNRIVYTLDGMGNHTANNLYDPSGALARSHSRVYNSLNELWKDVNAGGGANVTTVFGYDSNMNQTSASAPLGRNTGNVYDELNRLKQITDPAGGITQLGYDAENDVTAIVDPLGHATSYSYSGFGDLKQRVSPDTGTTLSTYDAAGNLATSTDARGKVATYSLDALNRITQVAYTDQTLGYSYDSGANGVGHLTGITDSSGSTSWAYTAQGRVASKVQTAGSVIKTISYSYNGAGQLATLTTPSGYVITYGYTNNRVTSVSVNTVNVLNGVQYEPFGATDGWSWGNGTLAVRSYDGDGKITAVDSAGMQTYSYDDASRVIGVADAQNSNLSWNYGYDTLDRLSSAGKTGLSQTFTYDANSNRLTQGGTTSSTYTVSAVSNQLSSISGALVRSYSYDASGNTTSDGTRTFTYNNAGRMISATNGGVTTNYIYNALGQRVRKSSTVGTSYFVYDEAGRLLGEYDASGVIIQETVWMDQTPVATIRVGGCGLAIFYVHTDHLNTPRRISKRSTADLVWRLDSDPFGSAAANANPSGLGVFSYNLRFPGQYFDAETGVNYNYRRDFDSSIGRQLESDPAGLKGGTNTYAYANGNPLSYIDPLGLWSLSIGAYAGLGGGVVITGTGLHFDSVGIRGGLGLGGGISFNPKGAELDSCAASKSNSFGTFAEVSASAGVIDMGVGVNAGLSTWTDSNGSVHYTSYGGGEPEISGGNGSGGVSLGLGLEAEGSAGVEWTRHF